MFVDRVTLEMSAGKGGNGVVAWRREKYIPKGGPCGGNGGKGGSVYLEADAQISSLDYFRNRKSIKAENGRQGGPNNQQGRNGQDLTLKVPCGTLVKDLATGHLIADLTEDKQVFLLCKGGKGGKGNDNFKSPTNRAPNICTPGKEGESLRVELELKLIADVGLVGFPNAGKSSLINALTRMEVKTAAYPFTTLQPNLGFIRLDDLSRIYIADIPGIIEGAHKNKGLGFEFLRHIERTSLLVYVLDASGIDGRTPWDDWKVLRSEMEAYNPELLERPFIVVLNKIDDDASEKNIKAFRKKYPFAANSLFEISALQGEGLPALVKSVVKKLKPKKAKDS